MRVSVSYAGRAGVLSCHAARVRDEFGIGFDDGRRVLFEDLEIPIDEARVVCVTGDSGSGKSSLLRGIAGQLDGVSWLDRLEFPDCSVIDAVGGDYAETISLLGSCGLGDAHLFLKRPNELSEGERYRFRLAYAISRRPVWIVADEFTATLDRTLAKVVSRNLGRLSERQGVRFLLATTHEDVVNDLQADLHVRCNLDGTLEIRGREKKTVGCLRLPMRAGSAAVPEATGRTSLGGIIGAIDSG